VEEKRSYIRKSLHSTVTVFDLDTKEYIGLLADYSDDGVLITSSIKPIPVGRTFHYMLLIPSDTTSGVDRTELNVTSIWSDCANESFYGTGFKLEHPSATIKSFLKASVKHQA